MQEVWEKIKNYPNYEISNLGRVRSLKFYSNVHKQYYDRILILKEKVNRWGYKYVGLSNQNGRKSIIIHRLVAETFLPNPDNLSEVNHIDRNKLNNKVNNLEWCTRSYNMTHSYKLGLRKSIKEYMKEKRKEIN